MYKYISNLVRITFPISKNLTSFSDIKYHDFNQILTEFSILRQMISQLVKTKLVINTDVCICIEYNRKIGSFRRYCENAGTYCSEEICSIFSVKVVYKKSEEYCQNLRKTQEYCSG